MASEEKKVLEALNYFGFEVKELSSRELQYTYLSFKSNLSGDESEYKKLENYYAELKDIRRTNEIIHNIQDPEHKEHWYTENEEKVEEVKPEIIDGPIPNERPEQVLRTNMGDIKIVDKPSILNIIISLLIPLYGFLTSIVVRSFMPKASRWYLVFAIIGVVINFAIIFLFNYYV